MAQAYYRYVKFLAEQNEPGTTTIYQDLRQHYHGGRKAEGKEKKPGDKKPEGKKPDDKKKPDNGGPDIHLPEE